MNRHEPADASIPSALELTQLINDHLTWTGACALPLAEAIAEHIVPADITARRGLVVRARDDYLITISKIILGG